MKRNIPEPLIAALRRALEENTEKMLRVAEDMSQHNQRAYRASGAKVSKLWDTVMNIPYKEEA